MLDVGFSELLVFGIITLLVLGPEKLPEAARFAAKWYSKFKRAITSVQNDIDRELRLSEFREQMQQEMQRIQELEQKMQAQMNELQQQSILAAEQQKQTILTENKKPSHIFKILYPLNTVVPSGYMTKIWLNKQLCLQQHTLSVKIEKIMPHELKVAV